MSQFIRKYEISVYNTKKTRLLQSSLLRVAFKIKKTLSSDPNKAEVKIYGLSQTTRNNLRQGFNRVILSAGYADNQGVIFDGQTTKTEVVRSGPDIITTLVAGDGALGIKGGSMSLSFKAGTSIKAVLEQVAKTMPDVKVGILKGIDNKTVPAGGYSFGGMTYLFLNSLGKSFNFSWSIQDGLLETVGIDPSKPGGTVDDAGKNAYVFNAGSGLVGLPQLQDNGQIKFKALLNPRIKPGRVVKVETQSELGNGFYKVSQVSYSGDSRGASWYVEINGVPLTTQKKKA